MTCIFYDGKDLHADRSVVTMGKPSILLRDKGKKLFVAKDNTYALALCGSIPPDAVLNVAHPLLSALARAIAKEAPGQKMKLMQYLPETKKLPRHLLLKLFQADIIMMTRSQCIFIDAAGESVLSDLGLANTELPENFLKVLEGPDIIPTHGYAVASGTGGDYVRGAFAVTGSVQESYRIAHMLDPLSGAEFDTVCADSLDIIVLEDEPCS